MTHGLPAYPILEATILSNCFYYPNDLDEALSILKGSDFYDPLYGTIFKYIERTAREGLTIDYSMAMVSLSSSVKKEQIERFLELKDLADPSVPIREYVQKVKEAAELRRLYFTCSQAMNDIIEKKSNQQEISAGIFKCMDMFTSGNTGGRYIEEITQDFNGKSLLDVLQERMECYRNGKPLFNGVQTYFPLLDKALGCFMNGSLTYIGARTNTGKTTFIMNIMANILCKSDKKICFFSAEMPDENILEKFLCMELGIPFQKCLHGMLSVEEFHKFTSLVSILNNDDSRRFIINDGPISISSLASKMRKYVKIDSVDIFFIDYLTLIKASGKHNNKHEKVDEVSKGLQSLAQELKVPVVCLAQFNRASVGQNPTLSDFRESGSIEEDCDVAILLNNKGLHDKSCDDSILDVFVAKNRLMSVICKIQYQRYEEAPGKWIELEAFESMKMVDLKVQEKEMADTGKML